MEEKQEKREVRKVDRMKFNKLKGVMREKNMSQKNLAVILGITEQGLNKKINGKTQFTLEELLKITKILEIKDPVEIFFAENIPNMQRVS